MRKMKKYSGGKILHFLLNCIDIFLAVGVFLGVILASLGSAKHKFGLEVLGIVMALFFAIVAFYYFKG